MEKRKPPFAPDAANERKEPLSVIALLVLPRHSAVMKHSLQIRLAQESDAGQISGLVQKTIRISNAQDYSHAVIERVVANFSTDTVQRLLKTRTVLVAIKNNVTVGTASLDGEVVRTVFVDPDVQGQGVGRQLMKAIEITAKRGGTTMLQVPASLTAKPFYAQLGYTEVRDVFHGEERTVIMEKGIG
ncbi:GNAT family N-acetyltransferase [Pseudotabrizicola formosa]|uniref:GNAT family N-acetyltransferase n=1 Tax=Pseudotabrizicola formosa TaxID=2030009 RepID=UPI001AEFF640|nr:GNAT family N-acetyltransferase [Pseudotabrizicola formosa]